MRSLVALIALAGCAAKPAVVEPPRVSLEHVLAERCGDCHDGEPNRPVFTGEAKMSPREAMQAALAVASARMPPPPAKLDLDAKKTLIALACDRTDGTQGDHHACADRLTRVEPSYWLLGARSLRALVDETAGVKPSADAGPFAVVEASVRAVRMNATLFALLVLYAEKQCGAPSAPTHAACLGSALDYARAALPEVPR